MMRLGFWISFRPVGVTTDFKVYTLFTDALTTNARAMGKKSEENCYANLKGDLAYLLVKTVLF